jgi:hypothetical protein
MFRSMSRVVVVAIVVFSFVVASTPAFAAPRDGSAAARAESGWFEAVFAWVYQVISGDQPDDSSKAKPMNGSCVDPFGRCS